MYAIANRTEAIVSNQQNSKQRIIIEFNNIDTRDDHIDDCLSAITCSHADQSLNTDESIKSPQRSTTDLPCFHKTKTPRRGRSCLSEYDKTSCASSFFHSEKSKQRIEKLYQTTGRSVSSVLWLQDFESKCQSKQIEYNKSSKTRRRKSLLKSLKNVNEIKRSKTKKSERKKASRRELTSVSSKVGKYDKEDHAKETSNKKKVEWYNIELDIVRDGCINVVNGWLNPVFDTSDDCSVITQNKVEEFIRQIVDESDDPKNSSIKKFVGKKLDKDTARRYKSIDNGAFSLWNNKFMEKFYEHKEKKDFVPIKRVYHTETVNVPRWFNT